MSARDPNAVARSESKRAVIRRVWREQWLKYSQCWPPGQAPTEKTISAELPFAMAPSTVYWHMERIREEDATAEPAQALELSQSI